MFFALVLKVVPWWDSLDMFLSYIMKTVGSENPYLNLWKREVERERDLEVTSK